MKKLLALFCASFLLAWALGSGVEAAPTIAISESPPYIHGQTIHVIANGIHGHDFQEVFCSQNSNPSQYVYWQVQPSGVYVLDSALWVSGETAFCRAIIWNPQQSKVEAQIDFTAN